MRSKKQSKGIVTSIAIVVIGGILVFLFQQGYLQFSSGPDLFVKEITLLRQVWPDSEIPMRFTIVNQGVKAAENCNLYYNDENNTSSNYKNSFVFSVVAGESEPVEIKTKKYDTPGKYFIDYVITCTNYKGEIFRTSINVEVP